MNKIIDPVSELLLLSDDELRETLLGEKYNKANLRELIHRIVAEHHNLLRELKIADAWLDSIRDILESSESAKHKIGDIEHELGYDYLK